MVMWFDEYRIKLFALPTPVATTDGRVMFIRKEQTIFWNDFFEVKNNTVVKKTVRLL